MEKADPERDEDEFFMAGFRKEIYRAV